MTQRVNTPDNRSNPGTPLEPRNFHRNFWATTGIATIVAAVIGAVATVLATKAPDERPQTLPTSAPAQTQAGGGALPPAKTTAATDAGVFWQGTFNFDSYVDFDTAPPHNGTGDLAQDVKGNLNVWNDGSVWTSTKPPTKDQCADGIATRAADRIPLEVGTQVCYQTPAGRVVYFKVIKMLEEGSILSNPRFEIRVVVWKR